MPCQGQPALVTMTQTAMGIFREDVAWMLLQVTGIAVSYLAIRKFMEKYRLLQSRWEGQSRRQTVTFLGTSDLSLSYLRLTLSSFRFQLESAISM